MSKKIVIGFIVFALVFGASFHTVQAQSMTLGQLIELFITLGIIPQDKAVAARALVAPTVTTATSSMPTIAVVGTPTIVQMVADNFSAGSSTTTIYSNFNVSISATEGDYSFEKPSLSPFVFAIYKNGVKTSIADYPSAAVSFQAPSAGVITAGLSGDVLFKITENNTITVPVSISFVPTGSSAQYSVALESVRYVTSTGTKKVSTSIKGAGTATVSAQGVVWNPPTVRRSLVCGAKGDLNGDGYIDKTDYDILGNVVVGNTTSSNLVADINGDGYISTTDWVVLGRYVNGLDTTLKGCVVVEVSPYHSADTNKDWKVSQEELDRVTLLYNTRVYIPAQTGYERTGEYHSEKGTVDGFAPGAGSHEGRLHSGDTNKDWRIDMNELTRVIAYKNSSGYKVQAGTIDGFAPIPKSVETTADIKVNNSDSPSAVLNDATVTISWNSTNATYCLGAGSVVSLTNGGTWGNNGQLGTSGQVSVIAHSGVIAGSPTIYFDIQCFNSNGSSVTDRVTLPITLVTTPTTVNNTISLVNPNGGATWSRGSAQTITWKLGVTNAPSWMAVENNLIPSNINMPTYGTLTAYNNYKPSYPLGNVPGPTRDSLTWTVNKTGFGDTVPDGSYYILTCLFYGDYSACDRSDSPIIIVTNPTVATSCIDSDGGQNPNTSGMTDGRVNGIGSYFSDVSVASNGGQCSGTTCTSVAEGYCTTDGKVTNTLMPCSTGYSVNGACATKPVVPSYEQASYYSESGYTVPDEPPYVEQPTYTEGGYYDQGGYGGGGQGGTEQQSNTGSKPNLGAVSVGFDAVTRLINLLK